MTASRHRAFVLASRSVQCASRASRGRRPSSSFARTASCIWLLTVAESLAPAGHGNKISQACKIRVRGGLVMTAARLVDFRDLPDLAGGSRSIAPSRAPANRGRPRRLCASRTPGSSVAIVTTLVPDISRGIVSVEPRDFPFPESAPGVRLGVARAFNRLSTPDRREAFALPGAEAAKRFVEAEFRSNLVGPPVNVVELGSAGIRWIAQSVACAILNRP